MEDRPFTLVLGGTGKTGRRVTQRLTRAGLPVRIGSRNAGVPFDWQAPATWEPALQGVRAAYVSYYPDLAAPGAAETIGAFADLATAAGVRRLVLLSGRGEDEAQACEKQVQAAGPEWTVLRCSWFAQNFSEDHLLDPILAGHVPLPATGVPEPFVDAEDIAEVAAAALSQDGHTGQIYELTGPGLVTFADAIAQIAGATGRDIAFAPVTAAEYAATLTEHGVPAQVVELLTYLFTTVLDGRNAHIGDGVQRALGRPARDFSEYVRRTAATGIWNQEQNR